MYFTLQSQIEEAKTLPVQDQEVKEAVIKTSNELTFIKEEITDIKGQLQTMENRLYELQQNIMAKVCRCCGQEIKSDSKYIWILDNGHGGIINGVYQTAGKRSPIWADGTQLFEGEFNRAIMGS